MYYNYPQIIEGLNKAEENRKNGVKGYTVDEVIASMDKIIEEAEKDAKINTRYL